VKRLAVTLAAVLATGCIGSRVPVVGEPPPVLKDSAAERAYLSTLERYTSRREIYDRLDTRLFAAATFQSASFVEARVRREASFRAQSSDKVASLIEQERAAVEPFHEFFLGVHLNNPRHDDFDKANSMWSLILATPAGEVAPAKVERLGRTNLSRRAIYPYLDDFWVAYAVRFPKVTANGQPSVPPGTTKLVLRVASVLGKADLEFPVQ
jgi:hypothetical protein